MKPIRLRMNAFLGFKDECIIDFTKLYDDRIFLITGATGAGKTSIFDGICYALYGKASSSDRDKADCYRSQLSGPKEDMEVELEFSVRGEKYTIMRTETYRGTSKVLFYRESDRQNALVKAREVNQEIEGILGLTLEQFKKIVMIPQGEFREFLASSTKDKSDILKKLFSTEVYQDFQDRIKAKYDESKKLDSELISRFKEAMGEAGISDRDIDMGEHPLQEKLEAMEIEKVRMEAETSEKEVLFKASEAEILAAEDNNKRLAIFKTAEKLLNELSFEEPKIIQDSRTLDGILKARLILPKEKELSSKAKELDSAVKNLEMALKDTERNEKQKESLAKEKEVSDGEYSKLDTLKAEKSMKSELLEKSVRLASARKRSESLQKEKIRLESEKVMLSERLKKADSLTAEESLFREKESKLSLEVSELKLKKLKLEGERKLLADAHRLLRKHAVEREKLVKAETEQMESSRKADDCMKAFEAAEELKKASLGAILRKDLIEGEPCPVCGSVHHQLTGGEASDFDEESYLSAQKALENARRELAKSDQKLEGLKSSLTEIEAELREFYLNSGLEETGIEEITSQGISKKEQIAKAEAEISEAEELRLEASSALVKLRIELEGLKGVKEKLDSIGLDLQMASEKLGAAKGEERTLEEQGADIDSKSVSDEIAGLGSRIETISRDHERITSSIRDTDLRLTALNERTGTLTKLRESLKSETERLRSELETSIASEGLAVSEYDLLKERVSEIPAMEKEISSFYEKLNKAKGAVAQLEEDCSGRSEISLEPLHEKKDQAKLRLEETRKSLSDVDKECFKLAGLLEKAKDTVSKYKANRERFGALFRLHSTASVGRSFETFVQSYYFDGILGMANKRLWKMSEGRFQLKRKEDQASRREKVGLDLNIHDAYTGRERDVLSLSGGESFKASLALALGLSDFIESSRGSVNLETIFIDEGFGSLDQDSLENALGCLMDLNVSGRIVGIISHVSELKERIPRKITVKSKPGAGSFAEIN
jgi:exonuclease SbcC